MQHEKADITPGQETGKKISNRLQGSTEGPAENFLDQIMTDGFF